MMKVSEEQDSNKNIPTVLYKYRDWKNEFHKSILTHGEIYFASPKDFNDPFDCRITDRFINRTKEEIENYKSKLIESHKNDLPPGKSFEEMKSGLELRMNDLSEFQKQSEINHYDMQDKYYGVLSLSQRWDSILMWAHYSNNHKGFCIGIKGTNLLKLMAKGGPVSYVVNYPDFQLRTLSEMTEMEMIDRMFIETHTKADDWSYEKEYRVSKNFFGQSNPERIDNLPKNSIVEIILGVAIDENDKNEILKVARIKNIPVFQSKKISFKFKIEREQIQ